jgi:ATP-dependent helicase/nuclease subunit A
MTEASRQQKILKSLPGEKQSAAADPMRSVWVGASAGTGKTKVLIDRVLRLMLPRPGMPAESATRPDKVLCLTFTKTAAAEMSNRIYRDLAAWAVMDDETLEEKLEELCGQPPDAVMLREARRLFARVLDAPGGLKIMTIHSFCQSVLKRFPVEAGLAPHFEVMDEQSAVEYLTRCQHDIIADARKNPDSAMAQALNILVLHLDSEGMADLMARVMSKRSLLTGIFKNHGDAEGRAENTVQKVRQHLGLADDETEAVLYNLVADLHPEDEKNLRRALEAFLQGSTKDLEKAEKMQPWLEQKDQRGALFPVYWNAFYTDQDKIRSGFGTKKVVALYPEIGDVMLREANRIAEIKEKLTALRLAEVNDALLVLAAEMVGRYAQYKRETDSLDYDDLIIFTRALLSEKGMVNWVLYKLDEGIDHILVDEAQDTSPAQWQVVRALAGDFFAGQGRENTILRTLFVVGDEKQSIFSFQGADPSEFDRMQKFFGEKAAVVQEGWEVLLDYSFRSTRTVLEVVDSVFEIETTRQGVVADVQRRVQHLPFRAGQAGMVELWPLITTENKKDADAWKTPLEIETGESPAVRMATKIAATIRGWLDKGEMLPSKGRPIRAGDVMILVQSRGVIVETLMRALKDMNVPVAGIDRLTLTEEIAVMDLLALASFSLQPRDDLTLATILKSPLVGLSEEELFDLCHARPGTLWAAVQERRPDVAESLSVWLTRGGYATPYAFFAEALNAPCFADKVSGRRAFYGRLGLDIHDALDEFLNSCLHYEQSHTPSLQMFTEWFRRGEAEIKREQDKHDIDQVRIMTVHASKGLQAPIVFLPDAARVGFDHNKGRARLLWPREEDKNGVPLWSPRTDYDSEVYAERQGEAQQKQEEEYRRLLYVALTRAEDRLYVCGYHGKNKPKPMCWYNLVAQAFPANAESYSFMKDDAGNDLMALRLSHPQEIAVAASATAKTKTEDVRKPLPSWVFELPPQEQMPPTPLAPSKPDEEEPAANSPLSRDDGWRFRRGNIIHHLLEILPQVDITMRQKTLDIYLAQQSLELTPEKQQAFAKEVMGILGHPEFSPIFGPGSRAEVSVTGLTGSKEKGIRVLSGQVDRLLVNESEVMIVDYKTNRPPPERAEDIAPVYLKQLAAYKSVLQSIYPGKTIRCALLWTEKPVLMPVPDKLIDPYAP